MRRLLILAIVLVAALANGQQEPYPGQSEHREPPEGWNCSHDKRAEPAKQCGCKRKCVLATDEEGNPTSEMTIQEDPACKVFCHPSHCHCEIKCGQT